MNLPKLRAPAPVARAFELAERERKALLAEMVQVKGLMPLLMKPRNKMEWSREDKDELKAHLRRLSHLSPYLVVIVMPGGFAMLPVLAWWLDRRRQRLSPSVRSHPHGVGGPGTLPDHRCLRGAGSCRSRSWCSRAGAPRSRRRRPRRRSPARRTSATARR